LEGAAREGRCHTCAVRHWHSLQEAMDDLAARPPEERLGVLVGEYETEAESLSGEDVRTLFVYAWPDGRDSFDDHSRELISMLHWIAPVRDVETYLVGTVTVYRAATDALGARWTLDEAQAKAAAKGGESLFRGTIEAIRVLGHFTGDGGNEVLVDPEDVLSVQRIPSPV
jgi:hypothetical protein